MHTAIAEHTVAVYYSRL